MSAVRTVRVGEATLILGRCEDHIGALQDIGAVITDPPYGMNAGTDSNRFTGGSSVEHRDRRRRGRCWPAVIGDNIEFDASHLLDVAPVTVLWGFNHFPRNLPPGTALVWLKRNDDAFGSFLSDAEVAWLSRGRGVYAFRDFSGHMEASTGGRAHPTQKPVALMRWCIERAKPAARSTILDPYMGSGSAGVAAVQMGYPFVGIECEPLYFATAVRRIEAAYRQGDLLRDVAPRPAAVTPDLFAPSEAAS